MTRPSPVAAGAAHLATRCGGRAAVAASGRGRDEMDTAKAGADAARRADGGGRGAARRRPWPADHLFAQGLHPADASSAATSATTAPSPNSGRAGHSRLSRRRRRCWPSPAPAPRRAAPRRCSRWATSRSCASRAAREALAALGHATTLDYLRAMCALVLKETGLLPHANPGVMTREEIAGAARRQRQPGHHAGERQPAPVRAGRAALRLARQGAGGAAGDAPPRRRAGRAVHHRHPDRHRRDARGADRERCWRSATCTRDHGHIQEVIVQNFRAKPDTKMVPAPEPDLEELLWTIAVARLILGPDDEHPGAAQPLARRLPAPGRGGARTTGAASRR